MTDTRTSDTRTRPDRAAGFHRLAVQAIAPLTPDAVAITLGTPAGPAGLFDFRAGQHLVLRRLIGGREERRTYSLCTAAGSGTLQVAVKRLTGGVVSTWLTEQLRVGDEVEVVSVLLHGRTTVLQMSRSGPTVLDALLGVRSDAPYACKSGVCGTCRARCVEGEVTMASNDALEPDEVQAGVVLTCQARPAAPTLRLEFC